ncbi:MAG: glycosyltransferase family 39 protein [Chloroflexota bacterium]|nr:glycosyltransferase family 39 protein [Chloroflexota bacterium]
MSDKNGSQPFTEPSVWDHFVKRIKFWEKDQPGDKNNIRELQPVEGKSISWLTIAALVLALIAQLTLEPSPTRTPWLGISLYAGALGCLIAAIIRKEWHLPELKPDAAAPLKISFRIEFLLTGIILAILAFLLFGNGRFTLLNTTLWLLSLCFVFLAFWQGKQSSLASIKSFLQSIQDEGWRIRFTRWGLIVLATIAVILFFNFHRLNSVPPEMVSDQAEKLLDISDVLQGQTPVYFPRNTGREVIHFYLTAAYMAVFNLDISFLNLKVVAVFANLLTLFFIFLLGKEVGNKWVGLIAALFAGMAYWPLLFTRLALRIPYYPLFVAPVMYFMIRGLHRQNINDILLTGLFLGLGLHGYTPFRIVPIFVVLGIAIFLLHRPGRTYRLGTIFSLIMITFVSLLIFIPLLRYWITNPELFAYRAFSRLTGMEIGFQQSPIVIFFQNFWKASIMFFWDNGVIWAHSIPGRPALDVVSSGLYFLGIAGLLIRYIRKRNWTDMFLLVSIPMLLMPSILSLAYPGENPCLNRTAGAVVPVFVVIGLALESSLRALWERLQGRIGKAAVVIIAVVLVTWSGLNNYDLVFNQYYNIYRVSSWNTSEIGHLAALFIDSLGSTETTYVVGYPHWVDSRLVAINAGHAGLDFAILPDQIPQTSENPNPKMFFLNVNDADNMQLLLETFPKGVFWQYDSEVENKDFMVFFVPPMPGEIP